MSEVGVEEKENLSARNYSKHRENEEDEYREEWKCCKKTESSKGGRIVISEPFLINELSRLVPYLENNCVKFHPLNMPHVKIGKIEVMGFVMSVKEDVKYFEIQVDDGTGQLTMFYEKKLHQSDLQMRQSIMRKCKNYAEKVDTIREGTDMLERFRRLETKKGLLGKKIARFDYIHATGYCALDFSFEKKPQEEITFKQLSAAKLNFLATKLRCIEEKEYNRKLKSWVTGVIQGRYLEPGTEQT